MARFPSFTLPRVYADKSNWSGFGTIGSNEALFAQQLYLVGDETDQPAGSLPQEGAQVVLFNQNAQGVLAGQNDNTDSPAVNNVSAQVAQEVRRHFPGKAFATVIPRNVRLAEAPSHGLPVTAYDRSSRGAKAYLDMAAEIREIL